jgi:hypothetical protein
MVGMWKRIWPAILITALAATAAHAFTLAETTATMGAHSAAAGSGGSSWTSAIGQTRQALGRNSNAGPANGTGWATGCSKGHSAARAATGARKWATGHSATQSAHR